ncbi:DUF4114 domain-containing protein [Lutibacter sp. TH_r2]|uniref:DUF4114 domain-containing protein n=1 Tax=Lutibacter sp. TH_r2 TaxID=3082083 RepID=UPI00295467ED|nr:DUF4114 domain-containing protein [Lutibacter sp. TH_r2]MDV7186825.1 DUF4114 domain-containing protein [Lutibacter sp. TH_r2]
MKQLLLLTVLFTSTIYAQNYQFLGSYTSNGTPQYLEESDNVSTETLELISNSLPESYPVPEYNPHYITSGYETDIHIEDNADVWVTFVSEGAGYRNVLGFYTYDIDNPITSAPEPEDITIIFPNVSALGSGGGLETGNKVNIGRFSPGTGIGWVLLANAWNGSNVTSGLWQLYSNPTFNPESNSELQYHNVLLNDPENERIILGFEDIRRDYNSCDNDFNDAIFYVTANPYSAIKTINYADVNSATDVTSANKGGLESNGNLASLIAKRNFNRIKANSFKHEKKLQAKFKSTTKTFSSKTNSEINLSALFPETGMFGTETSFTSSPTDLIGITNAKQVFSVDYYEGEERVSAALATYSENGIYDHSKVICDRLNSSSLEDIRTIYLNGHEIIMIKIERENKLIEYALNFSLEVTESQYNLHSYWNIAEYPNANYLNFQIWGGSMGQVSAIANSVLAKVQEEKPLSSENKLDRIPTVFVKKGTYKNGELHLTVKNKSEASSLYFEGNVRATENVETEFVALDGYLSKDFEEDITISIGSMFDIGFSVKANNSPQQDALYLADGPWGIDYVESETKITNFDISNSNSEYLDKNYSVERNVSVEGEVYGTANLFRNILPGELVFNTSNYENIELKIQNNLPIEVILVTENLENWENRLRYNLPVNNSEISTSISLADFKDQNGNSADYTKIRGLVFSIQGDYSSFQPFLIKISDLIFSNSKTLSLNEIEITKENNIYNYPNPFKSSTTLVLPENSENTTVIISDLLGRIVYNNALKTTFSNKITLNLGYLQPGVYKLIALTNATKMQTSIVVE